MNAHNAWIPCRGHSLIFIFECVRALKGIQVPAPVYIGDIILKNVADTGVDIVATKNVE